MPVSHRLELPGTEAVKEAVIRGLELALLPELRLGALNLPGLRRPLSRVSTDRAQLSHAARTFLKVLEDRGG